MSIKRANNKREAKENISGYYERHHILPKCMGGPDLLANYSFLTLREHFICHVLLVNIFKGTEYQYKIAYAMASMGYNANSHRLLTARQFSTIKTLRKYTQGKPAHNKGVTGYKNGPCTETRQQNIREARLNTIPIECRYCKEFIDPGNYTKYHGENCKMCTTLPLNPRADLYFNPPPKKPRKISDKIECVYCMKLFTPGNYNSFHGENCYLCPTLPLNERAYKYQNPEPKKEYSKIEIKCEYCNTLIAEKHYKNYHGDQCHLYPKLPLNKRAIEYNNVKQKAIEFLYTEPNYSNLEDPGICKYCVTLFSTKRYAIGPHLLCCESFKRLLDNDLPPHLS